jgi:hypothetical protein
MYLMHDDILADLFRQEADGEDLEGDSDLEASPDEGPNVDRSIPFKEE